ncbi:hypothetical protein [Natronohydrobacter thiooxidans]|uniref:hypothetical protein n=1 Tax=Natronohydrobacter thiooxidans TaxID=87172 RepID=UPI00158737BD|nr:hypothetical protein [Natronohydrobacter thiooxidans]
MLTVRGVDPEMGRAIKPLSAPEPIDALPKEKAREESGVAMPLAAGTLDRPAPRKSTALRQAREKDPVAAGLAPCDDAVTIWLALHPLQRHAECLHALRAQGVEIAILFRLAWQQFNDALVFVPHYQKPEPYIWWRAHVHRKRIKLPASLLADISRDARDFGALKPSELVAGQIQRQWIDALDKAIARVEGEV